MSPTPLRPRRPRKPHRHAWMRILALLVVTVLAVGTHVEALSGASVAASASAESGGGCEHDALDTPMRPPARPEHGPLTALRPAPGRPEPEPRPRHVRPSDPRTPHALRSVVLRC
ncbi:hypothetical protein OG762_23180 [Streptomyces sp. NBC_01136]|uniref:hypothetical protein n=1 Tax=unclassified Streptomyces TaxID=2593676 RepID=UPI003243D46C|nr:hypothetical protein OG762_23180 [Streptomyces sp. NBC_01136]